MAQDRLTGMLNPPQIKAFSAPQPTFQPQDSGTSPTSPMMPGQAQINQTMGMGQQQQQFTPQPTQSPLAMAEGGQVSDELAGIKNTIRAEFASRGLDFDRFIQNPAVMDEVGKSIQAHGNNGDTILAHINPQEAQLLKEMGGSGDTNPHTGLPQFDNPSMGAYDAPSGGYGNASNYTGGSNLGGYGGSGSGSSSWSGGGGSSWSGGGRDSSSSNQSPTWSGSGGSRPSTGGNVNNYIGGSNLGGYSGSGAGKPVTGGGGSSQNTVSPAGPAAPSVNLGSGDTRPVSTPSIGTPSFANVNPVSGMPEDTRSIPSVSVPATIAGGLGAFAPNDTGVQAYAPLSDLDISTGNSPLSSPDTGFYDLDAIALQRQARQNAEIAQQQDIFDARQRLQNIQNSAIDQAQTVAPTVAQTGLTGFEAALGTTPIVGPSMSSQVGSLFTPNVTSPTAFGSSIPQAGAFATPAQSVAALGSGIPDMQMEAALSIMGGGSFDLGGIPTGGYQPAVSAQPVATGGQSLEDIMGTTPQGNYLYSGITPGAAIGPEQYSLNVDKAYEEWGAKNPGLKAALELPFMGGVNTFNAKIPEMLQEKPIGEAVTYDPTSRTFTITDPNSPAVAELKSPGMSDLSSYLTDITKYGPSTTNWGAPAPIDSYPVSYGAGPQTFADLTPLGPETPPEPLGSVPMFAQTIGAPSLSIQPVNMGNVPAYSPELAQASFPDAQQIADIQQTYSYTPGFNDTMVAEPQQPGILNTIGNFLMPSAQAATLPQTALAPDEFQTAQQTPAANLFTGNIPLPPDRPEVLAAAVEKTPAPVKAAIKAQAGTSTNPPANTEQPQTAYDQQVAALEDAGMIANGMSKEEYADFIGVPVSDVKTRVTSAFGPPMAEYYTKSLFEAMAGMTGGKDNLTGAANILSLTTPMGILGLMGRAVYNGLTADEEPVKTQSGGRNDQPLPRRRRKMAEGGMVEGTDEMMQISPLMMAAANNAAPQIQYLARPIAYAPLNFATPKLNIPRSQFAAPLLPPTPTPNQPGPVTPPVTPPTPPVTHPTPPTTPTNPTGPNRPRLPNPGSGPKTPRTGGKTPRGVPKPTAASPLAALADRLDAAQAAPPTVNQPGFADRYLEQAKQLLAGNGFGGNTPTPAPTPAPAPPQNGLNFAENFGFLSRMRPAEQQRFVLESEFNSNPSLQQRYGTFDRFYKTTFAPFGLGAAAGRLPVDKVGTFVDNVVMPMTGLYERGRS